MLSIVAKNVQGVVKQFEKDAKQIRFATWKTVNDTAKLAKKSIDSEMLSSFRFPTPFIRKSLRIGFASKSLIKGSKQIIADVGFKDVFGKTGEDVADILNPHIHGGPRKPKASERRLRRANLIRANEWLIPSRTAPLDRYGNIKRGVMQRILSDLNAHTEAGYTANRTKGRARYIIGTVGNTKGIFRVGKDIGLGRWRLVFLIVKKTPMYKRRFKFYETGERTVLKHFDRVFDVNLKRALKTAR